jgi:uncharacterized protein (TIGR02246 family)
MRIVGFFPVLLIAAACTTSKTMPGDTTAAAARKESTSASTAANDDSAKAAIGKVRDAYKDASNHKDAASVAALYSDDATFVGTETPLVTGKEELQKSFAQSLPISKLESIDAKETVVSGDIAYEYGTFKEEVTPPKQKTMTINGYYLVAMKRQSDGSWKIVHHVATTPPAKP